MDYKLWTDVVSLYRQDPIRHVFLLYDLIYQVRIIDIYFLLNDGIIGYIMIWKGAKPYLTYLFGSASQLLEKLKLYDTLKINIESGQEYMVDKIRKIGKVSLEQEFYIMKADRLSFKPPATNINIKELDISDVNGLIKLKNMQGRPINRDDALNRLKNILYHGVYHNKILVSIAGVYARLPEVWVLGDVYTHPNFRGRGYGKAVVSAITKKALMCGANIILYVEKSNNIAIDLYRKLGYYKIGAFKTYYFESIN